MLSIAKWREFFTNFGQWLGWGLVILFGLPLVIGFGWSQYSHPNQRGNGASAQTGNVVSVNGEDISNVQYSAFKHIEGIDEQITQTQSGGGHADQIALMQGEAVYRLIDNTIVAQEAKRLGVRANDKELDKLLQGLKNSRVGPGATDAAFESYVDQTFGMSMSDFRDFVGRLMLSRVLVNTMKAQQNVTEADAKNQTAEVKVATVFVPAQSAGAPPSMIPTGNRPLPDAEAQKIIQELHAVAASSPSLKGLKAPHAARILPGAAWQKPFTATMGYGKDFDDAVQKTPKGQLTPVVKVTGYQSGYLFGRVEDQRNILPKDFNAKAAVDALKMQRAGEAAMLRVVALRKSAKITFADKQEKAYYDLFMQRQMQRDQMTAMFNPTASTAGAPTPAQVQAQDTMVRAEFEQMVKDHPQDATAATAAMVLAGILEGSERRVAPPEAAAINSRLISLYEQVLKNTEDRDVRFKLVALYLKQNQPGPALQQLATISRLLDIGGAYDLAAMQNEVQVRQQLATQYKALNQPDLMSAQTAKIAQLNEKIIQETKKQAAAKKAADDAAKAYKLHSGTTPAGTPQGAVAPGARAPAGNAPSPAANTPAPAGK